MKFTKKMGYTFAMASMFSVALSGCGGGGGSDESDSFSYNGLYANSNDHVFMVVDSQRPNENIIVGDFLNNAIIVSHKATVSSNRLSIKGLTYIDLSTWVYDEALAGSVLFNDDVVTLSAVIENQNYLYSMKKTDNSLSLSNIAGTHTNSIDGSVWSVALDGTFQINTGCFISGTMSRNGVYFDVTAQAENCADSSLNGQYTGVMATALYGGSHYLAGVMSSDTGAIWGSVPL